MKIIRLLLAALIPVLVAAGSASAHKVHVFAYIDNQTVYTESYFSDGKPVIGAAVKAFTAGENREYAAGKTDKQGLFSFPYTETHDLTIILDATMGHKGTFTLTIPKP